MKKFLLILGYLLISISSMAFADNLFGQSSPNAGVLKPLNPATVETGYGIDGITVNATNAANFIFMVTDDGTISTYYNSSSGILHLQTSLPSSASMITIAPSGKYAYTVGGDSIVSMYSMDNSGNLLPLQSPTIPTGSDPVGIAITPSGQYAYVISRLDYTISMYSINQNTGQLTALKSAKIPTSPGPSYIQVGPLGTNVYVLSDDNTLSVYGISPITGQLTLKQNIHLNGSGDGFGKLAFNLLGEKEYVYVYTNASGNVLSMYTMDKSSGKLVAQSLPNLKVSNVTGMAIDSSGTYAYLTEYPGNRVAMYRISKNGQLTPLKPATIPTGNTPSAIAIVPGSNGTQYVYVANYDGTTSMYQIQN